MRRTDDGELTITATDLDQSLQTSCAAKVKKPGACTIPARKLYDYIKLLPEGDISIKLMDNHWVQIRAGRSNTKMVGMARANFPQVPEFPAAGGFKISAASLQNMIAKDIFCDLERGVALHAERRAAGAEGGVDGDGGDGWTPPGAHREDGRDARRHFGREEDADPAQGAGRAERAARNMEPQTTDKAPQFIEFADDEQTLFFRVGGRVLTSRKLTGQFPNYEAVLPRDNNKFVIVRSEDLMASIQRVAQFADERSGAIKIRLEQNELKLSAQSTDSGESEDIIETPYNYDPLVVGFNSSYLIDFLKAIGDTGEVRLEFKDAQSAGQMRPEDGNEDDALPLHPDADAHLSPARRARRASRKDRDEGATTTSATYAGLANKGPLTRAGLLLLSLPYSIFTSHCSLLNGQMSTSCSTE